MREPRPTPDTLVTVFGGSGFVGRYVVRELAKRGCRVRVAVRRPELATHVMTQGTTGQVLPIQANLRNLPSVERAVEGADAVVNLVGILFESGRQTFAAVQAEGAQTVAEAARAAGARAFVQVSAIGADPGAASLYAQSKAAGEGAVLQALPQASVVRPSIVFGPEDDFFNRFASLARFMPVLPLIGGGGTRFQPVYAGDVGKAIAAALLASLEGGPAAALVQGRTFELGGPGVKSFKDCMDFILATTNRRRLLVPVPAGVARAMATVLERAPGKPLLTADQVALLERDNVVSEAAKRDGRTLEGLGIEPASVEAIVPTYLWRFRRGGQFEASKAA